MNLFAELQRRNVFRVVAAYAVAAWLLAQIADIALESFGAPDGAMRALLIILALGLPVVALFAWVFELTPEGIKVDTREPANPEFRAGVKRRLNTIIIVFLTSAVVLLLVERTIYGRSAPDTANETAVADAATDAEPTATAAPPSIAVLPFDDLSPGNDQAYLGDGIAEELLGRLGTKVRGLRIVSATSSFRFRDSEQSIQDIGAALGASHIVEGSISRIGEDLAIRATLIEVATDSQVWRSRYDEQFKNWLRIEQDIARNIADELALVLDGEAVPVEPVVSEKARDDYLRGRHLLHGRNPDDVRRAMTLFKGALAESPNFVDAMSALAIAEITLPVYQRQGIADDWDSDMAAGINRSAQLAQSALSINPRQVEALTVMGDVARYRHRWADAERYYQRALEIAPDDPLANLWYVEFLQDAGFNQRAVEIGERALALDPFSPGANANLAGSYLNEGQCEALAPVARAAADLGNFFGYFAPLMCATAAGNWNEAADVLEQLPEPVQSDQDLEAARIMRAYANQELTAGDALERFQAIGVATDASVTLLTYLGQPETA
ncbi:MAG: tetratricopeptide repeat protein, partial [Pseudomonadota bacterium]